MNIGDAMEAIKTGARVQRAGWVAKGNTWIAYSPFQGAVPASAFVSTAVAAYVATLPGGTIAVAPSILYKDSANGLHEGWTPSQADALAEDWALV